MRRLLPLEPKGPHAVVGATMRLLWSLYPMGLLMMMPERPWAVADAHGATMSLLLTTMLLLLVEHP
jgi:hypothetical protein